MVPFEQRTSFFSFVASDLFGHINILCRNQYLNEISGDEMWWLWIIGHKNANKHFVFGQQNDGNFAKQKQNFCVLGKKKRENQIENLRQQILMVC